MSVCLIKTDFLQPHGHRSTAKVLWNTFNPAWKDEASVLDLEH
jgi:hypothetical protein